MATILLPKIAAVTPFFRQVPVVIVLTEGASAITNALPQILAAMGHILPSGIATPPRASNHPSGERTALQRAVGGAGLLSKPAPSTPTSPIAATQVLPKSTQLRSSNSPSRTRRSPRSSRRLEINYLGAAEITLALKLINPGSANPAPPPASLHDQRCLAFLAAGSDGRDSSPSGLPPPPHRQLCSSSSAA